MMYIDINNTDVDRKSLQDHAVPEALGAITQKLYRTPNLTILGLMIS